MPSTVAQVFSGAGLTPSGVMPWGQLVPERGPGVYAVALTNHVDRVAASGSRCPLSARAITELLRARPELRLDGSRPSLEQLSQRLSALWLPDETVLYIGLAGKSVQSRVSTYYRTPLGARRPHAGGWPLKALSVLPDLSVFFAPCDDPDAAELQMLDAFIGQVSPASRATLHDPDLPVPFANLQRDKGQRKLHGITGAREPASKAASPSQMVTHRRQAARMPAASTPSRARPASRAPITHAGPMRTQPVTETDIEAGRIRLPSSAKRAFPAERSEVQIVLRGHPLTARWHPHYDRDQERSGVLSVGRQLLAAHLQRNDVLVVGQSGGRVTLS
jgi:hypothetical protein